MNDRHPLLSHLHAVQPEGGKILNNSVDYGRQHKYFSLCAYDQEFFISRPGS